MFGNLSGQDYLNYHLIMEGFYYDAAIEHITEIVKNRLYFAVLAGENNRAIKSTHDTCYFNIDDELVYVNYYYDFGPLNISCLYKYCCKLNSYLRCSQGSKRFVHYTTAHPMKRVNAAFLMGCFMIVYLKMEPTDIYRILLNAGGTFKSFVDASQGISQYTIRILDCLHAIQKALVFNFVNFDDFNVNEYDLFDKLQNGDMNWLLPRKFLAFIGPTDSEMTSGHPPDFYVRYFLDNDIKTVIRLNNKFYNASAFTQAGIEHHELFFPDGSVPSKQILMQFLDLCENARAAIAVHCKAGLGRTGSLIGAYIIKHYRLTAREAIAWMRICRPGSVIGQQQGWLEKIESWLWKQGSLYRLQHFGEGDKIPHHKYGIYSFQWPKERERIIRQVQRRKLAILNNSRARSGIENSTRLENNLPILKNPVRSAVTSKSASPKSPNYIQKPILATEKEEIRKISKLFDKIQQNTQNRTGENKCFPEIKEIYRMQDSPFLNSHYQEEISTNAAKPKHATTTYKKTSEFEENQKGRVSNINPKRFVNTAPTYEYYEPKGRTKLDFNDDFHAKPKKREQSGTREKAEETNMDNRKRRQFTEDLGPTQGDKLNEIKAQRFAASVGSESNANGIKQVKPRKQLTNVAMYGTKSTSTTPKKQEMETILPIKRSYFEQHSYTSRV